MDHASPESKILLLVTALAFKKPRRRFPWILISRLLPIVIDHFGSRPVLSILTNPRDLGVCIRYGDPACTAEHSERRIGINPKGV